MIYYCTKTRKRTYLIATIDHDSNALYIKYNTF